MDTSNFKEVFTSPALDILRAENAKLKSEMESLVLYKNLAEQYGLSVFCDIAEINAENAKLREQLAELETNRGNSVLVPEPELKKLRERVGELEFSWAGCSQQLKDACDDLGKAEAQVEKLRDALKVAEAALQSISAGPGDNRLLTAMRWAKDALATIRSALEIGKAMGE